MHISVSSCIRLIPCSAKHKRPMTLVIDDVQNLLKQKPAFLDTLQRFAKREADIGHLRVVFVSSDFTALTHMQRRSEFSRCKVMEIGESDVKEDDAIQCLLTKLKWTTDAQRDVARTYACDAVAGTLSVS